MARTCKETLIEKWAEQKHVCVGLDPVWEQMPECITAGYSGRGPKIKNFLVEIADATRDIAAAYKPNLAFYLAEGMQGLWALQEVVNHIKCTSPGTPVILDGKFGDVGLTCEQYAKFAFDVLGVDAATVNPWGGKDDGLDAFFKREGKLVFVWCKSSNAGSAELQDISLPGGVRYRGKTDTGVDCLYDFVAKRIGSTESYPEEGWNENGNCGVVAGAGDFDWYAIDVIRSFVGGMPMLIPGIGAQDRKSVV